MKYKITANIVCNNENFWIKESILSIVNMVDEIIYVDDKSTDGSLETVKRLSNEYNNIKIFEYKDHKLSKLGDMKNFAKENSKNDLVIRWDADFIAYEDINKLFEFSINNFQKYDAYVLTGPNLEGDIYHSPIENETFGPECYLFKKDNMSFVKNERYNDYPYFKNNSKYCYPTNTDLKKNHFFIHMNKLKSLEKLAFRNNMSAYHNSNTELDYWSWLGSSKEKQIEIVKNKKIKIKDFDFEKWGDHPKLLMYSDSVNVFKINKLNDYEYMIDYPLK